MTSETKLDNPGSKKIRIILADDHPMVRQALRMWLEKQLDFEIVAEACDGEEATKLATELAPDVIIMDINMPKLNGLEATRQIVQKCPDINVLVLTVYDDNEHILNILRVGAGGYLTKSVSNEELIHSIRSLVAGDTVLSRAVSKSLINYVFSNIKSPQISRTAIDKLTSKELEILKLMAKGTSNKEIALKLDLSIRSIKSYIVNMFLKLGVSSRTEAIAISLRAGILNLKDLE
jgi:two-component system, NarL family, response regulator LiaR